MRVAVIGASGLVGATLVERLLTQKDCEVVPFVRASGNAWRLARLGIELRLLDLLDRGQVEAALEGCTHVVNCSRGGDDVMIDGLRHLLQASQKHGIKHFVHLSSIMVYGDPPSPQSNIENALANPEKGSYGAVKLKQDEMVRKVAASGLPCTVLCPPNISGPYSYYMLGLVDAIRNGSLALVNEGAPCMLDDVSNLSHAIELALSRSEGDGSRYFITDDSGATWKDVLQELAPILPAGAIDRLPRLTVEALTDLNAEPANESASVLRSVKHLVSSDVRAALRKDPFWAAVDTRVRRAVAAMGSSVEDKIRLSVEGPIAIPKEASGPSINARLSAHQLRSTVHSCDRAKSILGYSPPYQFVESMAAFRYWYRKHQGMDSEYADLIAQLG
jgi:nucleoside-diphosphate-sugar epimerase